MERVTYRDATHLKTLNKIFTFQRHFLLQICQKRCYFIHDMHVSASKSNIKLSSLGEKVFRWHLLKFQDTL